MGTPEDGRISNETANETIHDVIAARLSRRGFLRGGLATAGAGLFGLDALLRAVPAKARKYRPGRLMGF